MRSGFVIVLLLFTCFHIAAQPLNEGKINRLAAYGKVWGFLKYYHPQVATGKFDWDATLVNNYFSVKNLNSNIELNQKISRLLDSVGYVPANRSKALDFPDSLKKNLNLAWIYDTSVLSFYNSKRLQYIYENHQPVNNVYVTRQPRVGNPVFKNEKYTKTLFYPLNHIASLHCSVTGMLLITFSHTFIKPTKNGIRF
ncbi:MAG: hypothetical protein HC905_23290 [Bacteroidales bacterium]|nr:hypothetical protein [Bacteroidales bacterium]